MANIDDYSARSGRIIGEDGKIYNEVDLLKASATTANDKNTGPFIHKLNISTSKTMLITSASPLEIGVLNNSKINVYIDIGGSEDLLVPANCYRVITKRKGSQLATFNITVYAESDGEGFVEIQLLKWINEREETPVIPQKPVS